MKLKKIFLCVALACSLTGCAARVKTVTNLPPGVTLRQAQTWDSAVANLHKVASTVSTFRKALTDLHSATYNGAPVLADAYYVDALQTIARIDQAELSAEAVLRQTPQNFSLSAKQQVGALVQQISTELQHLNTTGATGIKNPKSLQEVNTLLADVSTIVALILAL
jgi:uncharacterized lipoprotein YajG